MPNRLARESSPYLLQHAHNPVDWYPWGEEAFARARAEDKPIFLSVGYSTCHWCHVMEHESFENEDIARLLNEHFVPVKVDREERPDVDRVYMAFVQATSGHGGWPMSVWLTPDLEPFHGGTYFPPTSRWGRPGFRELLAEIARLWRDERSRVREAASRITAQLRELTVRRVEAPRTVAGPEALVEGAHQFAQAFDELWGGFGPAPKFPRPSELLLLLRVHAQTGDAGLRDMVTDTLRAMALGGMRDHIGGGFHRYSVDREWRVPHFEKMLYDQAQLVLALLETAQVTGEDFWRWVAEDTLDYVRRDLTDAEGGFFSAEDADSVPPEAAGQPDARKTEGAFYLWRDEELEALLGPDAAVVRQRFGIRPEGNAPHDPHGEFAGKNLLYVASSVADIAKATGRTESEVLAVLDGARLRMFTHREQRPRPARDDKILTGWNGLMIAAFARAARVADGTAPEGSSGDARSWQQAAEAAARFLHAHLWDAARGVLRRRFRQGQAAIDGYAEDYAFLIWGLLELFQATGEPRWLEWAMTLQRRQDELFWDAAEGGWFDTTGQDPSVLLRLKEEYDGAEPAPSSVSVANLLVLSHLVHDPTWSDKVTATLARYGHRLGAAGRVLPFMLSNLAAYHGGLDQIVIVGPADRADTRALRRAVAARYLPFAVVIPVEPGEHQARLAALLPWVAALREVDGRSTAYVCRGFTCDRPVTDPEQLGRLLDQRGRPS